MIDVDEYRAALAQALRERREELDVSQDWAAESAGTSQNSLSDWENERHWPRMDLFLRLCDSLRTAPSAMHARAETIMHDRAAMTDDGRTDRARSARQRST